MSYKLIFKFIFLASIFLAISLIFILLTLTVLISKKKNTIREKVSPFECGFEPNSSKHHAFSVRFFFILLIFLIFDVEIVIILPLVNRLSHYDLFLVLVNMVFMLILILGLILELKLGTLK